MSDKQKLPKGKGSIPQEVDLHTMNSQTSLISSGNSLWADLKTETTPKEKAPARNMLAEQRHVEARRPSGPRGKSMPLPADVEEQVESLVRKYDRGEDGRLGSNEIKAMVHDLYPYCTQRTKRSSIDKRASGVQLGQNLDHEVSVLVQKYDTNNDGKLSSDEVKSIVQDLYKTKRAKSRWMAGAVSLLVIALIANFALVVTAAYMTRELETQDDGVLHVAHTSTPVLTGSVEMSVTGDVVSNAATLDDHEEVNYFNAPALTGRNSHKPLEVSTTQQELPLYFAPALPHHILEKVDSLAVTTVNFDLLEEVTSHIRVSGYDWINETHMIFKDITNERYLEIVNGRATLVYREGPTLNQLLLLQLSSQLWGSESRSLLQIYVDEQLPQVAINGTNTSKAPAYEALAKIGLHTPLANYRIDVCAASIECSSLKLDGVDVEDISLGALEGLLDSSAPVVAELRAAAEQLAAHYDERRKLRMAEDEAEELAGTVIDTLYDISEIERERLYHRHAKLRTGSARRLGLFKKKKGLGLKKLAKKAGDAITDAILDPIEDAAVSGFNAALAAIKKKLNWGNWGGGRNGTDSSCFFDTFGACVTVVEHYVEGDGCNEQDDATSFLPDLRELSFKCGVNSGVFDQSVLRDNENWEEYNPQCGRFTVNGVSYDIWMAEPNNAISSFQMERGGNPAFAAGTRVQESSNLLGFGSFLFHALGSDDDTSDPMYNSRYVAQIFDRLGMQCYAIELMNFALDRAGNDHVLTGVPTEFVASGQIDFAALEAACTPNFKSAIEACGADGSSYTLDVMKNDMVTLSSAMPDYKIIYALMIRASASYCYGFTQGIDLMLGVLFDMLAGDDPAVKAWVLSFKWEVPDLTWQDFTFSFGTYYERGTVCGKFDKFLALFVQAVRVQGAMVEEETSGCAESHSMWHHTVSQSLVKAAAHLDMLDDVY